MDPTYTQAAAPLPRPMYLGSLLGEGGCDSGLGCVICRRIRRLCGLCLPSRLHLRRLCGQDRGPLLRRHPLVVVWPHPVQASIQGQFGLSGVQR